MTVDPTTSLMVKAALANMVRKGWFSICTIDEILAATRAIPDRDAMARLRLLHCVNFSDMDPELRKQLPALIRQALAGVELDVDAIVNLRPAPLQLVDVPGIIEEEAPKGFWRRLTG